MYHCSFFYLFRRLDNLERIIDNRMKLLFDFVNRSHQSTSPNTPNDTMESKNDVDVD